MSELLVQTLPQTAPISALRNRQSELLDMTETGPVVLLSRNTPSAVLISPTYWNAIANTMARLQLYSTPIQEARPVSNRIGAENVDALAQIAALAQPLGPEDLSVNFDIYTNQVLDDEFTE